MAGGLYRVENAWAHVQTDVGVISVSRSDYVAAGYKPRFQDLPTKEIYEAWVSGHPPSGGEGPYLSTAAANLLSWSWLISA
jgi:hypothetical protein